MPMNPALLVLGAIAMLAGIAILVVALRNRGDGNDPRSNAMLIGGMMIAAFGLLMAGFAIGYATGEPIGSGAPA